jgi:glycosyltransferase involved in cell wall biosynthesis
VVKILHIASMQKGSGVASFLMSYFRCIDQSKINFYFLSASNIINNYDEEIIRLGGTVFTSPYYKHNLFRYILYLNKVMKNESFDVIHCHEFVLSILALIIAKRRGIRARIVHSHSRSIDSMLKRFIVFFSRRLFKIFATDFFACSEEAGIFLFGSACKPIIINNALDVNKFIFNDDARKRVRNALHIADGFRVIGHVGRFSQIKNHVFLIRVFVDVLLKYPNCILLLVGDGEKYQEIKNRAADLKISDKVIFYGLSDNTDELYSAMDVFVFSSLFEGLGIVGIEAQCAGLPVVASKNIPRQMQISDLVSWLDLNEGPDKWADEITRLLSQKNSRQDMSNIITDAGYNILAESKRLEQRYIELYKRSKVV